MSEAGPNDAIVGNHRLVGGLIAMSVLLIALAAAAGLAIGRTQAPVPPTLAPVLTHCQGAWSTSVGSVMATCQYDVNRTVTFPIDVQ